MEEAGNKGEMLGRKFVNLIKKKLNVLSGYLTRFESDSDPLACVRFGRTERAERAAHRRSVRPSGRRPKLADPALRPVALLVINKKWF